MTRASAAAIAIAIAALLTSGAAAAQVAAPSIHARQGRRLVVRNAMIITGNAKPPFGPADIIVYHGISTATTSPSPSATADPDTLNIDATGQYVMPGIINTHMHWHEERQPGIPQPIQYERNLYLAAGVTTAREVGGDFDSSKRWQAESVAHTIAAPRILVYPFVDKGRTGAPSEIRAWIRDIKSRGADGLKIIGADRDQLEAILDEARKLGLRTAAPIAVEDPCSTDVMTVNGRVRPNLSALAPSDKVENVHGGGIEWTIKDGIPYHAPTLMREVKEVVARAPAERRPRSTAGGAGGR